MGNKYSTNCSLDDFSDVFPPDNVPGMSSAIALSGLWRLCTRPDFGGAKRDVDAIDQVQKISSLADFNDNVRSVQLIRAS